MDCGDDDPVAQQRRRTWMMNEYEILSGLNHPHIIRLYDAFYYNNYVQLVTDL